MQEALNTLINAIDEDYAKWINVSGAKDDTAREIKEKMTKEFIGSTEIKVGKKYIKIIKDRGVWGFVVRVDNDKTFKKGDILKAAGYNQPSRNKARGNIIEGGYSITWTGPNYII